MTTGHQLAELFNGTLHNATAVSICNRSTDRQANNFGMVTSACVTGTPSLPTIIVVIKGFIMVTIMSAAVFGNLLVIVSVFRYEKLRLIANTFIVSLASTDLLVACLVMPFSATKELAGVWPYGQLACDVFNANDVLFSTASLLHLCCISVDRYVAITDPLRYEDRLTVGRVTAMLAGVWIVSAIISHLPIHMGWYTTAAQMKLTSTTGDCNCSFEVNRIYGVISSAISFWTPAIIMILTYRKIYEEAIKQKKYIDSMNALSSREPSTDRLQNCVAADDIASREYRSSDLYLAPPAPGGGGGGLTHNPSGVSLDRQPDRSLSSSVDRNLNRKLCCQNRKRFRREHKAAKTLGIIMGAFLACWMPFFVWYLTTALCGTHCDQPHAVEATLFWVGYLNSALNPIIYALRNRDFGDAFRRLLRCHSRRRPPQHGHAQNNDCGKAIARSPEEISLR